jgi:hypothetical protein
MPQLALRARQAVTLVVATLALAACDDGGSGPDVLFDPGSANEIAHTGLIDPADVPGEGWQTVSEDDFDDGPIDLQTEACDALNAKREISRAQVREARAGRASRELAREGEVFPTSVESDIAIFSDSEAPAMALRNFKSELDGREFDRCFRDQLEASLEGAEAGVTTRKANLLVEPPPDGLGQAYDITITAEGTAAALRLEAYSWRIGNAGVTIRIVGPATDVTQELVNAAVNNVRMRMEALAVE